jgi:hypothetical protein
MGTTASTLSGVATAPMSPDRIARSPGAIRSVRARARMHTARRPDLRGAARVVPARTYLDAVRRVEGSDPWH